MDSGAGRPASISQFCRLLGDLQQLPNLCSSSPDGIKRRQRHTCLVEPLRRVSEMHKEVRRRCLAQVSAQQKGLWSTLGFPVRKKWYGLNKNMHKHEWKWCICTTASWGTHVSPWLFHFNVWQNPLQIKKKKKEKKTGYMCQMPSTMIY